MPHFTQLLIWSTVRGVARTLMFLFRVRYPTASTGMFTSIQLKDGSFHLIRYTRGGAKAGG